MVRNVKQLLIVSFLFLAHSFDPCLAMEKDQRDVSFEEKYDQTVFENFDHYKKMIKEILEKNRSNLQGRLFYDLQKSFEGMKKTHDILPLLRIIARGGAYKSFDLKDCSTQERATLLSLGTRIDGLKEVAPSSEIYTLGKKLINQCKNTEISPEEIGDTIGQLHKQFIIPNFTFNFFIPISLDYFESFCGEMSVPQEIHTPLLHAIHHSNMTAVEALITKAGVDVNIYNFECSETALHKAVLKENLNIIKFLLKHGANINEKERLSNDTPLHYAVIKGNLAIVKLLVENGADCTLRNEREKTPLGLALDSKKNEIVNYLIHRKK